MLRRFLSITVAELTAAGVRQFLDIGSGLPTADNTHEVAQRAAPESRIVYVDHDPAVISEARALLTSSAAGKTDYIQADLAPGSYLAIGHAASDIEAGTAAAMARSYNASAALRIMPRDWASVARFFDGMEMTGPGLLPLAEWGSGAGIPVRSGLSCYCGVARKP